MEDEGYEIAEVSNDIGESGPLRRPGFSVFTQHTTDGDSRHEHGHEEEKKVDEAAYKLLENIRASLIGSNTVFETPFGKRKMLYADYTASGRSVGFIEDFIREEVLPTYANTHTSTSLSGLQTTLYRAEARAIVGRCVNSSKDDEVLFVGSGATAAVNLLVRVMFRKVSPEKLKKIVIFVGPFEHHSNLLPWRETGAKIVNIREDFEGKTGIDLKHLEAELAAHQSYDMKIGTFSATSNLTGIVTDTMKVTYLLKKYGALSFWDYAAGAPYLDIDMNPVSADKAVAKELLEKDAIFISAHKMIGGVGSCGCLVVKKRILAQSLRDEAEKEKALPPVNPGGGTVFFVTENTQRYLDTFYEREEGGTPDIVGSIRTGLAFQLRESLGIKFIESLESQISQKVLSRLGQHKQIELYGNPAISHEQRVPIVSFNIKFGTSSLLLHYGFVCALLNDLFGIQVRGGCACAGPYGQRLLGIDEELALDFERELLKKNELLRPGVVRVSFTYVMSSEEVDYLCDAIEFVATHGWKFLPMYGYRLDSGEWRHRSYMTKFLDRRWLGDVSYKTGEMIAKPRREQISSLDVRVAFESYLSEAAKLVLDLDAVKPMSYRRDMVDQTQLLGQGAQELRWFVLPSEALSKLKNFEPKRHNSPFKPVKLAHVVPSADSSLVEEKVSSPIAESSAALESKEDAEKERAENVPCRNCFHRHGVDVPECVFCRCVDYVPSRAKDKQTIMRVEKKVKRYVGQALRDYNMVKEGDRIMVALSGGKDSLTLLHILLALKKKSPVKFEVGACTIDPQHPEYDPSPLKKYLESLGVPYFYEESPIMRLAKTCMDSKRVSICSFCARMKRGNLYSAARREGYNVIAMGQHLDDLAESFLMSAFHNGCLRTMKANYHVEEGDIRVIRPLVYVRERLTRQYASVRDLPIVNENCPACFDEPKERARIKQVLAAQEHIHPDLFSSMLKAMDPLIRMENRSILAGVADIDDDAGKL
jgi:selenocysteine lyase/cysteine desulfurase/tRNA(Ile)-lysidine synthase TilS/MesJ